VKKFLASESTLILVHVYTCCCRYVADPATTNDVKLIDTRCISAYLTPDDPEVR